MIRMSLDMRRIMMCVALCFYLQASIVYVLMLSVIEDCFLFFSSESKRYLLLTRHLHKDSIQNSIMATRRRAHDC